MQAAAGRKLFTTVYGSRLFGTNTPQSDTDWKHIVLPPLDALLVCREVKCTNRGTNTEHGVGNGKDDVDEEFVPLQTFARHFLEGQTYALELAFAVDADLGSITGHPPPDGVAADPDTGAVPLQVRHDAYFRDVFVPDLRRRFLTKNVTKLMGYARAQAVSYTGSAKRVAAATVVQAYVTGKLEAHRTGNEAKIAAQRAERARKVAAGEALEPFVPPRKLNQQMRCSVRDLVSGPNAAEFAAVFEKTEGVMTFVVGGKTVMGPAVEGEEQRPAIPADPATEDFSIRFHGALCHHNSAAKSLLEIVDAVLNKYGDRAVKASKERTDWKAMMHALRVVDEGVALLGTGTLAFPLPQESRDLYLQIRRGEVEREVIADLIEQRIRHLDVLVGDRDPHGAAGTGAVTRELTPALKQEFDEWLAAHLRCFYGIT